MKVNKLEILEVMKITKTSKQGREYNRNIALVKCPRCERIYTRSFDNITEASKCKICSRIENSFNSRGKGSTTIGELSGTFISSIREKARSRNIKWEVTNEDLYNLLVKQNFKCALSGIPLLLNAITVRTSTGKSAHVNSSKITASLDRIDFRKDYTIDNVQWVHKVVNIMKNTLFDNDFIWICKKIAENNKEDNSEPSFTTGNCSNAIVKKVQRLTVEEIHPIIQTRESYILKPEDNDIV